MSIYVIGKLIDEKGRSIAYKLYNSDDKITSELCAKEDAKNLIINKNIDIVGLVLKQHPDYNDTSIIRSVIKENRQIFDMRKMNLLDCCGNQLGESKLILLGAKGFGHNRQFRCVDSSGVELMIKYNEFVSMVESQKILGAIINNNNLTIHRSCKNQIYN